MLTDHDDFDDYDWYDEEPREPPEFGCCLPPGECCMPGLHFPSECHTSDYYDIQHEAEQTMFRLFRSDLWFRVAKIDCRR